MFETGGFTANGTANRAVVATWHTADMTLRGMFETEIDLARPAFCMTVHADHAAATRTFAGNALEADFAPTDMAFHRTAGADRVL